MTSSAPESLGWAAATGRFRFLKETSGRIDAIKAKRAAARGTPLRLLNANMASLLENLREGGDGYCGIAANFFPGLIVWLCRHYETHPDLARRLHRFLTLAQEAARPKYPASAKRHIEMEGLGITTACRSCAPAFTENDLRVLGALREESKEWEGRCCSFSNSSADRSA